MMRRTIEYVKPDYYGGGIVNLMSSIGAHFGKKNSYPSLRSLPSKELTSKNIVLLVIDGMGYEYLRTHGKDTQLWKHCLGHMTSVLPSTTAAAITTFETGTAPLQHGISGWYVHLKELGMDATVLRVQSRMGTQIPVERSSIFDYPSFYTMRTHIVTQDLIASSYTRRKNFKIHAYKTLNGMFALTVKALRAPGKKYVYTYWPEFDHALHDHGTGHAFPKKHLHEIDKAFTRFLKDIQDTDTTIIVTADHGLMTVKNSIKMSDHPILDDTLVMPISGEPRFAYCYVRPRQTKIFERYVRTKLRHACDLHNSDELIKQGWFGYGKPHPQFHNRVGDYVLVMKPGYIIDQPIPKNKPSSILIGQHGGMSKEEMLVPLIVVKTGLRRTNID